MPDPVDPDRVWREVGRVRVRGVEGRRCRDLVAHLDEYAVGEGQRQTEQPPSLSDRHLEPLIYWTDAGYTTLALGDKQLLDLGAAAAAATELAEAIERVRARHPARVEKEANAAMRRRYKLSPEEAGTD